MSLVHITSFICVGIPVRGDASRIRRRSSAALACLRAKSEVIVTKDLTRDSTSSIRLRQDLVSSTDEISLLCRRSEACGTVRCGRAIRAYSSNTGLTLKKSLSRFGALDKVASLS